MKFSRCMSAAGAAAMLLGLALTARPARAEEPFAKAKWVWFDEGDPIADAPAETRWFLRTFKIEDGKEIKKATLTFTIDNSGTATVNTKKAGEVTEWQKAQVVDVKASLTKGDNVVAIAATNEGGPAGLIAVLKIEFTAGDPLVLSTDKDWLATDKKPAEGWDKVGFETKEWKKVKVLASYGEDPWGNQVELP